MGKFEIKDTFYLNGQPYQIISGAFHYFRTVPEYWRDRLEKLKAMGANTVETYIPWNMHEPKRGEFCFDGMLDVVSFIKLAQELGLYVIIRPSPYICAEWEFGGLPAWLLKDRDIKYRLSEGKFLDYVSEYYAVLMKKLVPLQVDNGGPIILMQIENEYGYYANDKNYLGAMKKLMEDNGIVVPFITSDGPYTDSLNAGCVPGVLPTGNFGSHAQERFEILKKYVKNGPLMCAEFWVGWFDHWGNGGHMTGDINQNVIDFDYMLKNGHVNIYMFEGGTNFGFMNGSNYYDELTPDVTSYDYDAILTEDGQITEKYKKFQEIAKKYYDVPEVKLTTKIERKAYGKLDLVEKVGLFESLDDISSPVESISPKSMELLDQNYGYILYHSTLDTEEGIDELRLWGANDRANIFVDDKPSAVLYDRQLLAPVKLGLTFERGANLDILMENMGRVNFGPHLEHQRKGIDQCVQINGHMHNHWKQYCLPLDNVEKLDFAKGYTEGKPGFYKFKFTADEIGDTFLDMAGFGKGCAFINGFNLGRFWEIGPQKRLYIPGPLIKKGENEIIIFETDGKHVDTIELKNEPDIG